MPADSRSPSPLRKRDAAAHAPSSAHASTRRRTSFSTSPSPTAPSRSHRSRHVEERHRSRKYDEEPRRHRHHERDRPRSRERSTSPRQSPERHRHRERQADKDHKSHSHHHRRRHGSHARSRSPIDRRQEGAKEHTRRDSRAVTSSSRHRHRSRESVTRRVRSKSPSRKSRQPLPSQNEAYLNGGEVAVQDPPKEKPNFGNTGLLAAESNKVTIGNGLEKHDIVLKYHEPPEARKPPSSDAWQVFVFKGTSTEPLETVKLYTRTCWLLGREIAVADIVLEHPSSSKQHAVFQFRHVQKTNEWGEKRGKVGLYVLDLDSANGTFLNGKRLDAARFVECRTGDVVKFGESEREYVLIQPPK